MKHHSNLYHLLLLLTALSSIIFTGCSKEKIVDEKPPPSVITTTIKKQNISIYIDAIGQVIAPVSVYVRPQVEGKLIKTYIDQGAFVNEGDVIYEIDPRPYQAAYDRVTAQLAHDQALLDYAEKRVERYKKVVDDDFISILKYEEYLSHAAAAAAQVESDRATVTAAKINLDFCKIIAPVSGKISYFNVDVGNILKVDDLDQITTILPYSPIDISFAVPQQQFELIRREQGNSGEWKFIATLPENSEKQFTGTTYFIDNQIDPSTGTILLKGKLPNENRALWPGQFIRVKVLYKVVHDALLVPESSILIGQNGHYLYIVDSDQKAIARDVEVLTKIGDSIAIDSSQLEAGDTVIVDGQLNVAQGSVVHQVEKNKQ